MAFAAIIAAAGIGRRMGGATPKQYLELGGRPILCHTLDRFRFLPGLAQLVVVVEPGREEGVRDDILRAGDYPAEWTVTAGGALRQESVANGLALVDDGCDTVLVHDGVRPFVTAKQIIACIAAAEESGAAILAAPVKETIKRVAEGRVVETVDRAQLWGVQTPQAFRTELLRRSMAAARDGFVGTDEASFVERLGEEVRVIEGDGRNIKITTPEDIIIGEAIAEEWR